MLHIDETVLLTLRTTEKLTQKEIAQRLRITTEYYNYLERGSKPITKPMTVKVVAEFGIENVLEAKKLANELKST